MNNDAKKLIDRLAREHSLSKEDYAFLVRAQDEETAAYAGALAAGVRREVYGTDVYIRGLIEIGNICRNDCLYCGIRRSNARACRYRLSEEEILACAEAGYRMGFRTVVLQGGEDFLPREDADMARAVRDFCAASFRRSNAPASRN